MKSIKYLLFFVIYMASFYLSYAQRLPAISLWPGGASGAKTNGGAEITNIHEPTGDHVISNIHDPSITPYIPSEKKATGIAIIIAPGGGHREIWIDHEGYNVAQLLAENGIAAFVLKYRLAREQNSTYTVEDHSVKDMLRAVRLVRSRAFEWHIDVNKIGIMGFSAGGQIAALADIKADSGRRDAEDPIEKLSSKPDFQVLIYPAWVNDITLSKQSSPAFILGGFKDMESISTGMPKLYLKFKEQNVPAELHIYANAAHGFGIRKGDKGASSKWMTPLIAWLYEINGINSDK
jgi:acetyl esterase/lipase